VKADVGDVIIVPGRKVGDGERRGRIVEVRGSDGGPPYLVRWESDDTEGLFFPATGAVRAVGRSG
jgi:hypothetical protein